MHMLLVVVGGVVLLGLFALFGELWGGNLAGVVIGTQAFIPIWLVIAVVNMWIGVTKAGYTAAQEFPILLVVFAIPAGLAAIALWQLTRS